MLEISTVVSIWNTLDVFVINILDIFDGVNLFFLIPGLQTVESGALL